MSKAPPQSHRDVCAYEPCDNKVSSDAKYCCEACAKAHSKKGEPRTADKRG